MWLYALAAAGAAFFFSQKASGSTVSQAVKNESIKRMFGLADVDPLEQGGTYSRSFDMQILEAANTWNVPFALIKAHAIKESSLKKDAYRNENPTNRTDRQGWCSRGLMQLLFWPGSTRFSQFGYPPSKIGDGSLLFDPSVNLDIAAQLIKSNLNQCKGNLRDAINMYNTGKTESQLVAPGQYVDKVIGYYTTIINKPDLA